MSAGTTSNAPTICMTMVTAMTTSMNISIMLDYDFMVNAFAAGGWSRSWRDSVGYFLVLRGRLLPVTRCPYRLCRRDGRGADRR